MRPAEASALTDIVADWAVARDDIRAMALVGSWARGNPQPASDLDLLLLSDQAADYRRRRQWLTEIGFRNAGFRLRSCQGATYGAAWSLHVRLRPAAEVELTFADCAWAGTEPVDPGTRAVVKDAIRIVRDKDGILARLVDAVRAERA